MDPDAAITELAQRWSEGDETALDELITLAYPTLRRLARRQLEASRDSTIDTTALVHEAYLRLARSPDNVWSSRAHFFAFCAKVMRRIIIDYARMQTTAKRGGTRIRVPLSEASPAVESQVVEALQVEEALEILADHNERMAHIVECRFYGGMSIDETAEVIGLSPRTVVREWTRARAYLLEALDASGGL